MEKVPELSLEERKQLLHTPVDLIDTSQPNHRIAWIYYALERY